MYYARHFGYDVPAGASEFDLFWSMVKGALRRDDEATLSIVLTRLAGAETMLPTDEIYEVEEAMEVLDKFDIDKLKQEKKDAEQRAAAFEAFRAEYSTKAAVVRAAAVPAAVDDKELPDFHILQSQAKEFVPVGSSIWRSAQGGWNGHCPPFKRCSATFAKHGGSEGALTYVLKKLWFLHCTKTGDPMTSCPWPSLRS